MTFSIPLFLYYFEVECFNFMFMIAKRTAVLMSIPVMDTKTAHSISIPYYYTLDNLIVIIILSKSLIFLGSKKTYTC